MGDSVAEGWLYTARGRVRQPSYGSALRTAISKDPRFNARSTKIGREYYLSSGDHTDERAAS